MMYAAATCNKPVLQASRSVNKPTMHCNNGASCPKLHIQRDQQRDISDRLLLAVLMAVLHARQHRTPHLCSKTTRQGEVVCTKDVCGMQDVAIPTPGVYWTSEKVLLAFPGQRRVTLVSKHCLANPKKTCTCTGVHSDIYSKSIQIQQLS
jgi:hypothetical protein